MRRWYELAFLIPALMTVGLLCDVGLHFLPLEMVAFRTWEPALRRSGSSLGPFQPGKTVIKHAAYGDLASMGNLPSLREYHDERLKADKFGYRNSYSLDQVTHVGIVVGDSFIVGSGEPVELTLPVRLTELAGGYFYNAGGSSSIDEDAIANEVDVTPAQVGQLAADLRLSSGIVVYELLERRLRQPPPAQRERSLQNLGPFLSFQGLRSRVITVVKRVRFAYLASIMGRPSAAIICRRMLKAIHNDVLLPNPFATDVVQRKLQNQDEMLFLPSDLDPISDSDSLAGPWAAYLAGYSGELAQRNLKMIVLLVPNKYTVYGALTQDAQQPTGEGLLADLERRLQVTGVPVIDATPDLQRVAAEELKFKQYAYWRDDTHWNARGITIATSQLWNRIEATPDAVALIQARTCGLGARDRNCVIRRAARLLSHK